MLETRTSVWRGGRSRDLRVTLVAQSEEAVQDVLVALEAWFDSLTVQTCENEERLGAFLDSEPQVIILACRQCAVRAHDTIFSRPNPPPVIFVGQPEDEELARKLLEAGAFDCVLRNELFQLCTSVHHAQEELLLRSQCENAGKALDYWVGLGHKIMDQLQEGICLHKDGRFTYMNPAGMMLLGFGSLEEVVGTPILDVVPPDFHEVVKKCVTRVSETGQSVEALEEVFVTRDGNEVDVAVIGVPFENGENQAIFWDISERKRLERERQVRALHDDALSSLSLLALSQISSEDLMREMTTLVADALEADYVTLYEPAEGRELAPNAGHGWECEHTGQVRIGLDEPYLSSFVMRHGLPVSVEDWETETRLRLLPAQRQCGVRSSIAVALQGPSGPTGTLAAHRKSLRRFEDVDLAFLQSAASIVTAAVERKRIEAQARILELSVQAVQQGVLVVGVEEERPCIYANPAVEKITGYRPEELLGRGVFTLMGKETDPAEVERLQIRVEAGEPCDCTLQLERKDGTPYWCEVHVAPVRDEGDRITYYAVCLTDVTDKVRAEAEVKASEERFRQLFENISSGVAILSAVDDGADFIITGANTAGERIEGITRQEVLGRRLSEMFPEYVRAGIAEVMRRVWETGESVRVPEVYIPSTRRPGWREGCVYKLRSGDIVAVYDDVSEWHEYQDRLRTQVRRLAALRQIDVAITSSLDVRLALIVVLDQVTTLLECDAADVLLLNRDDRMLRREAVRGIDHTDCAVATYADGHGSVWRAVHERAPILLREADLETLQRDEAAEIFTQGFRTVVMVPLVAKAEVRGVLRTFHTAAFEPDTDWMDYLDALATQTALAVDNALLFRDIQHSNAEVIQAYDATLEGWTRALDLRDRETEGHTQRVTSMAVRLARRMGFSSEELVHVRRGALLHDIGKMGVPDAVLHKPGPLTDEEWVLMRKHPKYAFDMISSIAYLRPVVDIPYCHHEKFDGTGYPRGLTGEEIPLAARVFAIVDVWDALSYDRPYRAAWPQEKVIEHIRSLSGTHFDPQVVDAFLRMLADDAEAQRQAA